MVVLLFLIPEKYVIVGPLNSVGNPAQMVGLLALGMWAARAVGAPASSADHPVRWMLFAWLLSALTSFAAGLTRVVVPVENDGATRSLVLFASVLGIALLALDGLKSREMVETVLFRLVLLAGLSAAIGILEFAAGLDFHGAAMHLPGLTSSSEELVGLRGGFARVQGGAADPIEYAVTLGAVAALALHFALTQPTRGRRITARLGLVAILVVTPLTVSRCGCWPWSSHWECMSST